MGLRLCRPPASDGPHRAHGARRGCPIGRRARPAAAPAPAADSSLRGGGHVCGRVRHCGEQRPGRRRRQRRPAEPPQEEEGIASVRRPPFSNSAPAPVPSPSLPRPPPADPTPLRPAVTFATSTTSPATTASPSAASARSTTSPASTSARPSAAGPKRATAPPSTHTRRAPRPGAPSSAPSPASTP